MLSSYLLASRGLARGRAAVPTFLARRVLRVYVPFAVSIAIAWLLCQVIGTEPVPGATSQVDEEWLHAAGWGDLLRNLALVGRRDETRLNSVTWSLVHQIRLWTVFPLVAALVARSTWSIPGLLATSLGGGALALALGQGWDFHYAVTVPVSLAITVYFAFPTVIGIALAQALPAARCLRRREAVAVLGIALAIMLVAQRWTVASATIPRDYAYGLSAALLIAAVVRSDLRLPAALGVPLGFVGRISFSVYLYHLVILVAVFRLFGEVCDLRLLAVLAFGLTGLVAWGAYRLVERPFQRLGARVGAPARLAPPGSGRSGPCSQSSVLSRHSSGNSTTSSILRR